jgi:L-asparaginase
MRSSFRWLFACLISLLIILAVASPARAQESRSPESRLPRVTILATGGTIAGVAPSPTDPSYKPSQLSVDVLIAAVPEIHDLAEVRGEQISQIASQDMNDDVWLGLAERVNEILASGDVDGVVITHGTDTMEETAYFLHLAVKNVRPVVLTGALRPSTALGADGALNLYNAVSVAADPEAAGRGVLVVMNDDIHGARDVTKSNVTDVQTFVSREKGLVGQSSYGDNRYFRKPVRKHTVECEFSTGELNELPRVDIVYAHAGMSPGIVDACVAAGAKGIVIAGTGNGNMAKSSIDALEKAVKKGVVVVRSTRCGTGVVGRNIEIDDDALGFIAADDLNPQKARVLLKLALTRTSDAAEIQKMFFNY